MNQVLFGGCPFCGKQSCIAGQCKIQQDIKRKKEYYDSQIKRIGEQIADLQLQCKHPDASHKDKANTGNYDPSCDSYWTDHYCPDCGKYWQTDQNWKHQ